MPRRYGRERPGRSDKSPASEFAARRTKRLALRITPRLAAAMPAAAGCEGGENESIWHPGPGRGDPGGGRMRGEIDVEHLVAEQGQRVGEGETRGQPQARVRHRPMLHRRRAALDSRARAAYSAATEDSMTRIARAALTLLVLAALPFTTAERADAAPEGTMTWGVHVTLANRWLDPAETEALVRPFLVLYAIHDALVKPMTGVASGPSLAESWTMS